MEDELWMRKIKERLEDYSEPLPRFRLGTIGEGYACFQAEAAHHSFPALGCGSGCGVACSGVFCQYMAIAKPCGRGNAEYGHADAGGCPG